jgi:uncharacterized membrane protein
MENETTDSSQKMSKLVIAISLITLLHASYSTLEHFQYTQKSQLNSPLPTDIVLELMISLLICMFSTIQLGNLKDIEDAIDVKHIELPIMVSTRRQYLFNKL